jgi:hypothetical protein
MFIQSLTLYYASSFQSVSIPSFHQFLSFHLQNCFIPSRFIPMFHPYVLHLLCFIPYVVLLSIYYKYDPFPAPFSYPPSVILSSFIPFSFLLFLLTYTNIYYIKPTSTSIYCLFLLFILYFILFLLQTSSNQALILTYAYPK